ncbi:hypothetical protein AB0B66_10570 [Catellatospora sp. NPDC049111]|uniref:hypothetical protein n=1 Tax=Catellatospora sp. NPDC049111 TaxID=3155271 RepID=UPI0033FB18E1
MLQQRRDHLLDLARQTDDLYATANLGVEAYRLRTAFPTIVWIIIRLTDADDPDWEYDYRCSTIRDHHGTTFVPPTADADALEALLDDFCYALRDSHGLTSRWPAYHMISEANLGLAADEESDTDAEKARRGELPKWVVINLDRLLADCRQLLDTGRLPETAPAHDE